MDAVLALFEYPGPVKHLWFQVPIYVVGTVVSLWVLWLYGSWLWRIRAQWETLPLGWMLFGMCLDRLAWALGEAWWGITKVTVAYGWADPAWLGQTGWLPKLIALFAMFIIIFSYYQARKVDK